MKLRILSALLLIAVSVHARAGETELNDVSTEMEELSADSEAAIAHAKQAKIRIAKETAENERKYKAAVKAREVAKGKRQEARKELKHDEATIDKLMKEQQRLKAGLQKSESDIAAADHAISDSRARTEKKKAETAALQNLTADKQHQFADLNKQRDQVVLDGKAADQQRDQAKAELKQATDEERTARKNFEAAVVEETKHKARVQEQIAALKDSYKASKDNIAKLDKQLTLIRQKNLKLEEQMAIGQAEVQKAKAHEAELKAQVAAVTPAAPR